MFDLSTYPEYLAGDETRYPYLGVTSSNAISIVYGDDPDTSYVFGGNPVIPDQGYMPERNAVNSIRGDKFDVWNCAPIRTPPIPAIGSPMAMGMCWLVKKPAL